MILKSFEINKIKIKDKNYYLLYGENEGHINEVIEKYFKSEYIENNYKYDEKDIINDKQQFFNSILSNSFFENEKLIIISRVSDKIKDIIEEIIEKKIPDLKIVLNSGILEKKSKLRSLFEKNKYTICIPFYSDNHQTLNGIINNFFRTKKIPISQQTVNLLIDRCRGNRQNLNNELNKIEKIHIDKKNTAERYKQFIILQLKN